MSEKILKKAKRTAMLRIGEDMKNSKWYHLTDNVKEFVYDKLTDEDIEKGVIVTEMRTEKRNGKLYIAFMKIEKTENEAVDEDVDVEIGEIEIPTEEVEKPVRKKTFSRDPKERKEIIAQAIGHMTSRVVAGMVSNGEYSTEEITDIVRIIYNSFLEVVKETIAEE